jgi:hypothetical protein
MSLIQLLGRLRGPFDRWRARPVLLSRFWTCSSFSLSWRMSASAPRTSWISLCRSRLLRGANIVGPCYLLEHSLPFWSNIIGLPTKSIRSYPNNIQPNFQAHFLGNLLAGTSHNQSPEGTDMALAYSEANCWLSGYCSVNSWNNRCAKAFCFSRRAARARIIFANGRR